MWLSNSYPFDNYHYTPVENDVMKHSLHKRMLDSNLGRGGVKCFCCGDRRNGRKGSSKGNRATKRFSNHKVRRLLKRELRQE